MNIEEKKAEELKDEATGIIERVEIDHEMRTAYIDYSMSVICLLYTSPSPRDS